MTKIVAVGGAPSSGTTLAADLLDSIPGFLCPPELYVLCCAEVYGWGADFKKLALKKSQTFKTLAPHAPEVTWLNRKYFRSLGLGGGKAAELLDPASDVCDFLARLGRHLGSLRNKEVNVFCEKTPLNVGWAEKFCETFPDATFLHVVRDPLFVVQSLMRRGYTLYESTLIYLHESVCGLNARKYENYIEIKYEDVLKQPFDFFADLSKRIGYAASSGQIEKGYHENAYRASLPRPASWTVSGSSLRVEQPRRLELTPVERDFVESAVLWKRDGMEFRTVTSTAEIRRQLTYPLPERTEHRDEARFTHLNYSRSAKNLVAEMSFLVLPQDQAFLGLAQQLDSAVGEVARLRRKLKTLVGNSDQPERDGSE